MMLKRTSKNFRIFFLKEFTRRLVENSQSKESLMINQSLRERLRENVQRKESRKRLFEEKKKTLFRIPRQIRQINLGKLNVLIRDSTITSIENPGKGENVIIRRFENEIRPTRIKLTRQEVNEIVENFFKGKLPKDAEGFEITKAGLTFSTTLSELAEGKFAIRKK